MSALVETHQEATVKTHPATEDRELIEKLAFELLFEIALRELTSGLETTYHD